MPDRKKVIQGLELCAGTDCVGCPYRGVSPCQNKLAADALALLKEQEARVLEYSEIEKHPLVWLEVNDTEDVIPALFLQYNGWGSEFVVQAQDKYVDVIVRSAKDVFDERTYGITWRAWSSRTTPGQMRDTPWEGDSDV